MSDQYRGNERISEDRPALSEQKVQYMLAACIRQQAAFDLAVPQLKPEHFSDGEMCYRIIWAAVLDFYRQHVRLPDHSMLANEVTQRVELDGEISDEDCEKLEVLLSVFYADYTWDVHVAMRFLRQFLEERLAAELHDKLGGRSRVPKDFFSLARTFTQKVASIGILDSRATSLPFPEDWTLEEARRPISPTGVAFLDPMMGGGHAVNEVQLYLGPYGSGKTTLAVQLSVSIGKKFLEEWIAGGRVGPRKLSYLVTYEEAGADLRRIALASTAPIDRDRLDLNDMGLLTTSDNLGNDDRKLFAMEIAAGQRVPGERERLAEAMALLNNTWRIINFSGVDSVPGTGGGLHDEVRTAIKRDLQMAEAAGQEVCCGSVTSDYVGAAVKRYMEANNVKRDLMRHPINEYPLRFKSDVLQHLGACGHIFHQLDTRTQSFKTGQIASHTDSSEGKAIGEACNFCFCMGKPNDQGLATLSQSKHRRTGHANVRIVRLNGKFATFHDTGDTYMLDTHSSQIVNKRDMARWQGDAGTPVAASDRPRPASVPGAANQAARQALREDQ